jgi:exocyst complex component 2
MTDYERTVVNHYNLPTSFPVEWPAEKDESEGSEDEDSSKIKLNAGVRRSKSRYSALERVGSDRKSLVPGSQRTKDGRDNLVQKDEPDPLGGSDSVVRVLRQRGLPVEEDIRLRNRFLLSSTTFSPTLFLSQTHSSASTQSLLQGLDFLSRSIDQKSASLKILVESNFERFVRAKATIDNVYTEMRNQGSQEDQKFIRPHSRQVSRTSAHFRNISGGGGIPQPEKGRKKNALTKESEYGVQGIKGPLLDVTSKAEEIWGPAIGGKEREKSLKSIAEEVELHRGLYEVGSKIAHSIKRKDYDSLVEEYSEARKYKSETTSIIDKAMKSNTPITDAQIQHVLATGRMWMDVDEQIQSFKREIWRRLTNINVGVPHKVMVAHGEEHMELIGILLELGVDDNPIWVWLLSRYDHLKNKITATSERAKVEIEILRRRLAAGERPTPQTTAVFLKLSIKETFEDQRVDLDTDRVVELWESILSYLSKLLSIQGGLLGEVIEFWEAAQSFIDGHKQKTLPTGIDGQSRKHHHLSSDGVRDLQNGAVELVNLIRENVLSLFVDPPIEDISLLFSPLPPSSPNTPSSSSMLSPRDARFKLDPNNIPPPSPKRGDSWEEFAFWPPYSNSMSGVYYLSKILIWIGSAASEMTSMRPISLGSKSYEQIKSFVNVCRERSVRALCASWNKDAECCRVLEDWTRAPEKKDLTKMPMHLIYYENAVLAGMQKVLYISEAMTKAGAGDIVTPPPAKLLQMVRSQFVTSIYKALSGMVENAEKAISTDGDEWAVISTAAACGPDAVDANNRVGETPSTHY